MLRRKPGAPIPTDPLDLELLEAIDEGVPWRGLLRSASCPPEEAEGRLLRLLAQGILEGAPGEDPAPPTSRTEPQARPAIRPQAPETTPPGPQVSRPSSAPTVPPRSMRAPTPSSAPTVPPRSQVAPAPSSAPARPTSTMPPSHQRTVPPKGSAGDALLRELMRRSGVGHVPVRAHSSAPPPSSRPAYDPYRSSTVPPRDTSASSVPPASRPASRPPAQGLDSTPPRTMSTPAMASIAVDSPLVGLIDELSHGSGLQRWAAARLREALAEELAQNFAQAVSILQVVMAQIEDARLRQQRDRLLQRVKQADSGIYRAHALKLERAMRHQEAVEHWTKVLDAFPNDVEAALHAAMCSMECGNLKQAGHFARRAVELSPNSVTAHRILHRFFRKSGMEASARREAEIIQKLRKA